MLVTHLDQKITTGEVEAVPNRNGYGDGLRAAAEQNQRVVALAADLTESTRTHHFAEAFPHRFIQCGVGEQNMASVASGLAANGKIPFMASYAIFSPGRNWEQIRTTIAYNDVNVKIIGAHAGVSVGPDGATHQAIEDMALMRVMPNMIVLAPCDVHEAKKAVLAAVEYEGPVYIRVARAPSPVVTTEDSPFSIGKAEYFYTKDDTHGQSIAILSTGTRAYDAIRAAKILEETQSIGASVIHVPTVAPLDTETVVAAATAHDAVVTVEEHQANGGFGSAITEYLSYTRPTYVMRVGVAQTFGQSGTPEELLHHYELDTEAIVAAAKRALEHL
jgi:transketolase